MVVLGGARGVLGACLVMRGRYGGFEPLGQVWEQALSDLRQAGAELVDVDYEPNQAMGNAEFTVLLHEGLDDGG